MRKLVHLILFLSFYTAAQAQVAVVDSFKREIAKAVTIKEKFTLTGQLSRVLMNVDLAEADRYGLQLIEMAEASRDRSLMVRAQLINGERYSYLAGKKENLERSISYYNKGLDMAKSNKLDTLIVSAYLSLSEINRFIPDAAKALAYCNQANSYTGLIKDDSLTARVHFEYGMVYVSSNEKLLALRNFMTGLRIAEEIDNPILLRSGYTRLSGFYATIDDIDKAIDYQVKAQKVLDRIHTGQVKYTKVQDLNTLGDLYASKKNYELARNYYEKALAAADSLKFDPMKSMTYQNIIKNYILSNEPQKALNYFNEHPLLKTYLESLGFGHFVDLSYGNIYANLGKYDSAKYYYNKVAAFFGAGVNTGNQFEYAYQLGKLYKATGETDRSISYFLQAKEMADKTGNLDAMSIAAKMLDSVYQQKGNYKEAIRYGEMNAKYKDSLITLGKEKDLMQVEAADEQQRQTRLEKEKEETKRRRNNIQYLGIVFGIIGLFVGLVILGMFKVSAGVIKAIGFFVFIMLFEFVFLVFKKNIYSITHGEPWKDLAFMIGLAALLVPLHHWIEHKVLHYLTSHNRLTSAGHHIKTKFFNRTKPKEQ